MRIPAYAKLNLTLEVLGRRNDGFHQVVTIMQTISLADVLEIKHDAELSVVCEYPDLKGEQNLVWQAAVALAKAGNVEPKARISIEKRIPVGMGLGGGSSDAATALLGLNALWGLGLTVERLAEIAATLGSDVAFFLWGGTALAEGKGEQISILPPIPNLPVTLVFPDLVIDNKTTSMYSKLTRGQFSDGGVTRQMIQLLTSGQFMKEAAGALVSNVFSEVASRSYPLLTDMCQKVMDAGGPVMHLCGAGPAFFTLPSSEEEHHLISELLQPHCAGVYLVTTVSGENCGPGSIPVWT